MAISIPINSNECKIKNLKLNYDKDEKQYYLSAVFRLEDKFAVKELTVPRIVLDIKDGLIIKEDSDPYYPYPNVNRPMYIDMGFGCLPIKSDIIKGHPGYRYYICETIEEKTQELTLSEIEKKLGYKVKIVAEKEK